MSTEFEAAGIASAGGLSSHLKADLSGKPCQNCGTPVEGRYCPNCGQLAASFHRPVYSLVSEILSDLTSYDGRLVRTLPRLFFMPGVLTRDYTLGRRARYVPPFRLFVIASVIFYLILFGLIDRSGWLMRDRLADPETGEISISIGDAEEVLVDENGNVDRDFARRALSGREGVTEDDLADADQFIDRVANIAENQDLFLAQLETWIPRLSFLSLPITILALVLLHFWRRSLYVYDHAVHALHLQSWMFLTGSIFLLLGQVIGGVSWTIFNIALVIYVWRSLVVATGTNAIMGLFRLLVLMLIWFALSASIVLAGVVISGLSI